jgi:hypothetical protein
MYSCMPALYMTALYPVICRSYIFLYAGPTYSYMSVLYTLICPCYILLFAGHVYSYMPFLHTLICRSYILLNVSHLYSNMSMLYTVIYQLPTLSYSDMRPYILLYVGVFSVLWSYLGEGDIVIHEFTQLILFEWPIKTPFLFLLLDTFNFKIINI